MDSVSRDIDGWLAQMPDVDGAVEELRQRIGRLSRQLDRVLDRTAEDHGISRGDWTALSVLVRSGGTATPGHLATTLELTSGTVSTRIRRLTTAGLVRRANGTGDARSRPVAVTAAGRRAWAAATATRTRREAEIVRAAVTDADLAHANNTLAAVLAAFEAHLGPAGQHDLPAPKHE